MNMQLDIIYFIITRYILNILRILFIVLMILQVFQMAYSYIPQQ